MITAKRCKDKSLHIETDIGVVNITENGGMLNNSTEIHIFDMSSPVKFEVRHFSDEIIDLDKKIKETKMKQATIYMEETGEYLGGYFLKGWKNVKSLRDIPVEYMNDVPRFYARGNTLVLDISVKYRIKLNIGSFITSYAFKKYLEAFKKAGQRLHKILQKPKIVEFKI